MKPGFIGFRHVMRILSARLLLLTILFVMLAEVLIYVPSVARFRQVWLEQKLDAAYLAALAVDASPTGQVDPTLTYRLLEAVGAYAVDVEMPDRRVRMITDAYRPVPAETFDLLASGPGTLISEALEALWRTDRRAIMVIGHPGVADGALVRLLVDEEPLLVEMLAFSQRILVLSVIISVFTASLVFLSLNGLMVRPMRRITESMVAFRERPDDADAMIQPSARRDEIGTAQRELAAMQHALRSALKQRERLAALGTAVTRINLRNLLSSAALVSERLTTIEDPEVRRLAPRVLKAIHRAVDLCSRTLDFTREEPPRLARASIDLRGLVVDDVLQNVVAGRSDPPCLKNEVPAGTRALADRKQLDPALSNLARNAVQAGAETVRISVEAQPGRLVVLVDDTGHGLPPRARDHLFVPFAGTARAGGTGLGLAIAKEIARAHGGDLRLVDSSAAGTVFALELPAAGASG